MNAHKLPDKIPFGQYRGLSFGEVCQQNPSYILWLNKNANISLDATVIEKANSFLVKKSSIVADYYREESRKTSKSSPLFDAPFGSSRAVNSIGFDDRDEDYPIY